jgi:hypothetical protein
MQLVRLAMLVVAAATLATPASAQFGGLKKKLKKATGEDTSAHAADPTPAAGGSVVLTPDVVNKLIAGLKAGEAERKAAAKEDSPYGRYQQAKRAYTESVTKCEAGRQAWAQKGDEKQVEKANTLIEKSLAAGQKGDSKTMQMYQDSVNLLQGGPSCLVKDPKQPENYYGMQRDIDVRANSAAVKGSGLSAGEFAMAQERSMAILRSGAPSDVSESEKSAVMAKKSELEPLLWPQEKPAVAAKAEPAPAPVQAPAAAAAPAPDPRATAAANKMGACMAKNMETHRAEIESLQKEAEAAQKAGDQSKLMAVAQRLQQIQMAGCTGH